MPTRAGSGDPTTISVNGITCSVMEAEGGVERAAGSEGPTAKVVFKCAYDDVDDLVHALMGTVNFDISQGTSFTFDLPWQFPPKPQLRCSSISAIRGLTPFRDTTGFLAYETAIVMAEFSPLPWDNPQITDVDIIPFSSVKFSSSPEVFSPPGGAFYMPDIKDSSGNGTPISESTVGFIRPHAEITWTRWMLPYYPLDAITYFEGKLNDGDCQFPSSDVIFTKGKVMFIGGGEGEPQSDPYSGLQTYKVDFKFMCNVDFDFNYFMGRDGKFHKLNTKADGTGDAPFSYADFSWFFGYDLASPDASGQNGGSGGGGG